MMKPHISFNLLLAASGMTRDEACDFLNVSRNTLDGWVKGRRSTPIGANKEMSLLISSQEKTVLQLIDMIQETSAKYPELSVIELGYPSDDYEANQLGFPCVNAWLAMAGRVVSWCEGQEPRIKVVLVPRGSTPATAKAIEMREK
jgi:hypothetical protein